MRTMISILRETRSSDTFRLRKVPDSFLEGVASILDTVGTLQSKYNVDRTDNEADFNSLQSDWKAVGKDLYFALRVYGRRK